MKSLKELLGNAPLQGCLIGNYDIAELSSLIRDFGSFETGEVYFVRDLDPSKSVDRAAWDALSDEARKSLEEQGFYPEGTSEIELFGDLTSPDCD